MIFCFGLRGSLLTWRVGFGLGSVWLDRRLVRGTSEMISASWNHPRCSYWLPCTQMSRHLSCQLQVTQLSSYDAVSQHYWLSTRKKNTLNNLCFGWNQSRIKSVIKNASKAFLFNFNPVRFWQFNSLTRQII